MRRPCLLALIVAVSGVLASSASAGKPTKSEETTAGPISVSSIKAVFIEKKLATEYSVDVTDVSQGKKKVDVWTLKLSLVDPAGSEPPGNAASHAAVDLTCDNAIVPKGAGYFPPPEGTVRELITWTDLGEDFIWYHGDKGAYNPSPYGCDHTRMGPSGHQGIVDLQLTSNDGNWSCSVAINGTNLSPVPEYSAAPTCTNELARRVDDLAKRVDKEIVNERDAAALVGKDNARATKAFADAALVLASAAASATYDGVPNDPVVALNTASESDRDAAHQDLGTSEGRQKALADAAAALKSKKTAAAGLEKFAKAQPPR
jgi:hypothetical protein